MKLSEIISKDDQINELAVAIKAYRNALNWYRKTYAAQDVSSVGPSLAIAWDNLKLDVPTKSTALEIKLNEQCMPLRTNKFKGHPYLGKK